MALCSGQGEVRVHDPAGDAARLLPLHQLKNAPLRLVLVGCGHAHALVLRQWADARPEGIDLTLITDRAETLYSGMLPGLLSGRYRREELTVSAEELARGAGARFLLGRVTGVDPAARTIALEDRSETAYDLLALDVGSTLAGLDVPEAGDDVLPARPPDALLRRFDDAEGVGSVVVVGGGAAGVELAAAVRVRVPGARVTLVEAGPRILPGYDEGVARRAGAALHRRKVVVRTGSPVLEVGARTVLLAGDELPADAVVWATGAAPHPWLRGSGLTTDEAGFLLVEDTLQLSGRTDVFASGDCAALVDRALPRAGVHAVRQAPVLGYNLAATATGRPLRRYHPQEDFLTLMNLGDGTALGTKWDRVVEGRWVQRLKDRIDRRFVRSLRI